MSVRDQKRRIRHAFGSAANSYDQVTQLQQRMAHRMIERLPREAVTSILDLGCGTGRPTAELARRLPAATVVGVDLAEPMLCQARRVQPRALHWVAADAEQLPFSAACFDLVFSSAAMQWCSDFSRTLGGIRRVLQPGGRMLLSTFGPATLNELRSAWCAADQHSHVNRFHSESALLAALKASDLSSFSTERRLLTLYYPDAISLMRALKAMGAQYLLEGRNRGLTGRHRLNRVVERYEEIRTEEGLPCTFEAINLEASVVKKSARGQRNEKSVPEQAERSLFTGSLS